MKLVEIVLKAVAFFFALPLFLFLFIKINIEFLALWSGLNTFMGPASITLAIALALMASLGSIPLVLRLKRVMAMGASLLVAIGVVLLFAIPAVKPNYYQSFLPLLVGFTSLLTGLVFGYDALLLQLFTRKHTATNAEPKVIATFR